MLCNIHFLVTWIGVESLRRCKVFQVMNHPPSLKDYDFFVMALVLGLVTPLNNASLKLNGIGFYQIFKLLLTPGVVLLEYLLDGKILSRSRSSSLMLVCFFVLISSRADMEFSVTGAALATLWIPFASMYKVQWGRLLKKYQCSTLSLMYVILPYAMVVQCAISPLVDPPGILQYKWTREAVFWIGLSGLSAFLVNYSGFLVIGNLGALTHVLLGQCKTAVIMVGAYILFQSHYSALQLRGALGAVLAIVMYTHVTVREMHLKEKKPLADEQSLPLVSSNEVPK
jgi:solute carrier family 35 protein E3